MSDAHAPARFAGLTLCDWTKKVAVFLVVAVFLGWFYGWASPRVFPKEKPLGFGYGTLHGALMPMALPSLVMGQDVDIFAANNSGRPYKLGYIVGINLCGLVFFGSLFWKPRKKISPSEAGAPGTVHINHPR
jgi:hypothetical protein